MAQDNATIARTFYEAWNDRDFDRAAELMADDGELVFVGSTTSFRGPDGVREFSQMWADAFPDGRVEIINLIASGDHVVVEFTGRGTQTGTLSSPAGEIPATGRAVTLEFCDVHEIRDGRVRGTRSYFDNVSLLTQLGVMPAATAAATT